MSTRSILIGLVGIGAAVALGLALYAAPTPRGDDGAWSNGELAHSAPASPSFEAQADDRGAVSIEVAPLDLSASSPEWTFRVVMDTHSVELGQNMTEVSVLIDDQGRRYKPVAWSGAEPGGHHREGVLTFMAISPMPRSLEISISDIGGVIRSFSWDLQ